MTIEVTRKEEFALITLNRPDALNALSFALIRDVGRALDEVAAPDDDRPDRAGEPLREAEGDRVGGAGELTGIDPERDDRVPEAGAVDVERDAALVRDGLKEKYTKRSEPSERFDWVKEK